VENKTCTYISLFSGAGIGCYGFAIEGFECIATNEIIKRRLAIQKANHKCKYESGYIEGDISLPEYQKQLFDQIDLWEKKENVRNVDVVIATPPCQGMSVANHKKTDHEIVRNSLVVESIRLIKKINPKFFIFENVAAFLKTECTDVDGKLKPIEESIYTNLGSQFSIYSNLINFKNYGACSSRTRTLVIGVNHSYADFVAPLELFPLYSKEKTLRESIGNLKELNTFGEIDQTDIFHSFRVYPASMRKWISTLGEGESAFQNTDLSMIPHKEIDGKLIVNQNKNGDKYRRQIWDKVGPCIHTRNDQLASQNTIHPRDDRVFSIRELMLMMTIPDEFKWVNSPLDKLNSLDIEEKREILKKNEINIRQSIGEAVPTAIFSSVAKKIKVFLNEKHHNISSINKIIVQNGLTSPVKLLEFIRQNKEIYGFSTLCKISELANAKRLQNAAYFTNKSILNEISKELPLIEKEEIRILEPSVGVGNFLPFIINKYSYAKELTIDVVDIDYFALELLNELIKKNGFPDNLIINFINSDFLTHAFLEKYDLVIGNPPFNKLLSTNLNLRVYKKNALNNQTSNTFVFFLEKALSLGNFVSLITPKSLLNTPEFKITRDQLAKLRIDSIIDFGESGFEDVLVETICINIIPNKKPKSTVIISIPRQVKKLQNQNYIFDPSLPYWVIYRDGYFDEITKKLEFDRFLVFRDRQITNSLLNPKTGIRVIRSRNINDDGTRIVSLKNYDSYIEEDKAKKLPVYDFLENDTVFLAPNMSYNPRVARKPRGALVNGSVAILIPKDKAEITTEQLIYFSSEEFRKFYRIARNYQTRSLNIDSSSVFFFGLKRIGR
jgi:DNA (cytosine-5)-methyltransferase 1